MKPKKEQVKGVLQHELQVGDPRDKVETVLTKAGISFTYDKYANRYQSNITDSRCGPYQAISLYINLDLSGRVSKIDVSETFTAP